MFQNVYEQAHNGENKAVERLIRTRQDFYMEYEKLSTRKYVVPC